MPYWSIGEWRARIGSSWCALGRPFKMRSPFRGKTTQRVLTLSQGVATLFLLIMSIGVNLGLRTLVARGHHLPLLNFSKGGTVPDRMYLINLGFILTLILHITSALVYQLLSMAIKRSKAGVCSDLSESLSFRSCFVYYSIFLILKMINPSTHPVHWLIISVIQTEISLSILWKDLANEQDLVEKLHYVDTKVEVVMMANCKLQGTWLLAVAKAVLDVALSVPASVILSLLLISGDIEENPGPVGDLDYKSIDNSQTLNEDDLTDIMEEVLDIKSMCFALGRSLRLRNDDIGAIRNKYPNKSDHEQALNDVLLLWLKKAYNVERFGPPTWRMLVEAVNKKSGGNNYELARQIALNHPAGNSIASLQEEIKQKTCDTEDILNINNIKEVLDEMWDYRARWKSIGIELCVDTGTLDAIEKDCRKVNDCLQEMIKHWLRNSPRPTREIIKVALQSKLVSNAAAVADDRKTEVTDSKLEEYTAYLKSLYKAKTQASFSGDDHWPPPVTDKVFNLAMIKPEEVQRRNIDDQFVRETITGKIDDILRKKIPITLEQMFEKAEQKKILVEGAPGCGKSTLSLHICHQWTAGQLLKEYSQVILVKLREEVVQNAKNVADLLPKRDVNMGYSTEKEITAHDGEGILFIFDGWDELPEKAPGCIIIRDILGCNKLHKSSVVITSRPISSINLHKLVNTRIEILGFTKAEQQKYFSECLENDRGKVVELLKRIKENPVVEGTCYLPLNACILVHLFKCEFGILPQTQFGFFSALIRHCIFRHLKKKNDQLGIPDAIKSLDELPAAIQNQFECICEIAYRGVMEDHITFELERSFNTLGLFQGVENFASGMPAHSYNFLHLSIQELLAAIHMATRLDPSEQVAQFKKLFGQARFSAVFQFYAAKTKLKTQGMNEIVIQVVQKCMEGKKVTELTPHSGTNLTGASSLGHKSQPLLLSLLHCLFEAQDEALCQLVAKELKGELTGLQNISLSPTDCLSVGYFLTHCGQFKVDLGNCSIGSDGCKLLFRKGPKYDLQYLNLGRNSINAEGAKALSDAIKTMADLQCLHLELNSIGAEGTKAISDAMKKIANLKVLDLGLNNIGDEGAKAISDAMKTMDNLQELALGGNSIGIEGTKAISDAMKTMSNLQVFFLGFSSINNEGAKILSDPLKTMANLQVFGLKGNAAIGDEGRKALEEAAKERGITIIF